MWQYISLMKRILLIDCPGVVPPNPGDSEEDILLRGVVRVENVENPAQYITAALKKCKLHHIYRTYGVNGWTNSIEFLEMLARKGGRLLKGGEPDIDGVAKMVINDFLRGKIPWYTSPPSECNKSTETLDIHGIEARNLPMKRKRQKEDIGGFEVEKRPVNSEAAEKTSNETVMDSFESFDDDNNDDDDDDDDDDASNGLQVFDQSAGGVSLSRNRDFK